MTKAAKTTDKALKAALKLAELTPWGDLILAAIAEEAGLKLKDLHGVTDKDQLSAAVEPFFDAAMSEGAFDEDETPRTRLFDVIMMRFEAMEDHRDGVMSYLRWRDRSLEGLALRLKARAATAKWALACTGLDGAERVPSGVQQVGLAWVISQAERGWRQETSTDLSRTMAALDGELRKMEERMGWWRKFRQRADKPSSSAETET